MEDRLNQDAAGYFREFKKVLQDAGRFQVGDEKALGRLCQMYSISDKLEDQINSSWGVQLPRDILPAYDKISKSILLLECAFQLNPNSRVKMKEQPKKEKKVFDTSMRVAK